MDPHSLSLKFLKKRQKAKGQILIEALVFIIFAMVFLILIQLFQSLARQEIQKERLSQHKVHKAPKARWLKKQEEEL